MYGHNRIPPVKPSLSQIRDQAKPADRTKGEPVVLLGFSVDDETTVRAWSETLSLARAQGLSVYDAAYLELAMRRGLPLATLDDKLKAAAQAVGVSLYPTS